MIVLDLDHMKELNDQLGQSCRRSGLIMVADAVRRSIRKGDVARRIGGDEIAIILLQGGERGAIRITGCIQQTLNGRGINSPPAFRLGVSLGSAQSGPGVADPESLLARAGSRLYVSREHARRAQAGLTPSAGSARFDGRQTV